MKDLFKKLSVSACYEQALTSVEVPLIEKIRFLRKLSSFCNKNKTDVIKIKNRFGSVQETVKVDEFAVKEILQQFDEVMEKIKKWRKHASLSYKN